MRAGPPELWKALKAQGDQKPNMHRGGMPPLARLLLGIVVISLLVAWFLSQVTAGRTITRFVSDNGIIILSVVLGALGVQLVSFVASEIVLFFPHRFRLTRDGQILDRLTKMEQRQHELYKHHEDMLQTLPKAIGGEFTDSLFKYGPQTSQAVAEALSKKVQGQFDRHYARVQVMHASDEYTIVGLKVEEFDEEKIVFWRVAFSSMWKWHNDSRTPAQPLKSFRIVTAPPAGYEDLLFEDRDDQNPRREAQAKYDSLLQRENLAFSPLGHPVNSERPLTQQQAQAMYHIDRLNVRFGDEGVHQVTNQMLVDARDELPLGGVYSILRIGDEIREQYLLCNKDLEVELVGEILVKATPYKNGYYGILHYGPSDLITQEYKAALEVPTNVSLGEAEFEIEHDTKECGHIPQPWKDLDPSSFRVTKGARGGTLLVPGPIHEDFRFQLAWKGTPLEAK